MAVYQFVKNIVVPSSRCYVIREFTFEPSPAVFTYVPATGGQNLQCYPAPNFWTYRFLLDGCLVPGVNDSGVINTWSGLGSQGFRQAFFIATERQTVTLQVSTPDIPNGYFGKQQNMTAVMEFRFNSLLGAGVPGPYQIANIKEHDWMHGRAGGKSDRANVQMVQQAPVAGSMMSTSSTTKK